MQRPIFQFLLGVLITLLTVLGLRLYDARPAVHADSSRFDHVQVISAGFVYNGGQGVLILDKRNGNVWFIQRGNDMKISFREPQFVVRVPLEKLDDQPR